MSAHILLVDDDGNLREVVRYALSREGYEVSEATNGSEALALARAHPFDLIVLDVMMPELDGLEACRQLRTFSQVPVIFLSSRDEEIDRILGLEIGGDDYVTKPFSPRELVSRVRAVLRRLRSTTPATSASEVAIGPVRLDLDGHQAYHANRPIPLTATEFRLLSALMRAPGRVFSREDLSKHAYPDARFVSGRTLDSHVRRIRAKFRPLDPIETVYGVGYRVATG